MMTTKQIRADYDDEGLYVYQAYRPEIGRYALGNQRFGGPFKMDRMTWIKPSFAWMLYRCGYGDKPGQEFVLRIKISHEGFRKILDDAVLSHYVPTIHGSEADFQGAKSRSECRVQWDPERDLRLHAQPRRAIQVGIRGSLVGRYVNEWIMSIDDATILAHAVRDAVGQVRRCRRSPRKNTTPCRANSATAWASTPPTDRTMGDEKAEFWREIKKASDPFSLFLLAR